MKNGKAFIFYIALLIIFMTNVSGQIDSVRKDLRFDPGFARGGQINLWPIFKKTRDSNQTELQIIFPLFSKKTLLNPKEKHLRVFPFYFADSTTRGTDRRVASLYYPSLLRFEKDSNEHGFNKSFKFLELAPGISGIQLSKTEKGLSVHNSLLFLLWYKRDSIEQKSHLVFFPIYWQYENSQDSTSLLFPLYYRYKNTHRKQQNIGLLYNHSEGKNWQTTSIIPIFQSRKSIFGADTTRSVIAFPLYFHFKNPNYTSTTILPIVSKGSSQDRLKKHFHIFPLYYSFENNSSKSRMIFPLLYYKKQEQKKSFTLFPFYHSLMDEERQVKRRYIALLYQRTSTPFLKKTNFLPLIYTGTRFKKDDTIKYRIIFPLYFSKKEDEVDNKMIIPVYFNLKNDQYRSVTLIPFYSFGQSSSTMRSHLHIFPFYWSVKRDAERYRSFVPLFYFGETPERKYTTLLPFFTSIRYDSGRSKQFFVFPLYYSVNSAAEKQKVLFPFWWQHYLIRSQGDTLRSSTLFPIFYKGSNRRGSYLTIFPFYFSSNAYLKSYHCLFPFYLHRKDGWTQDDLKAISPLYWRWKKSDESKYSYLFPLYWSKKEYHEYDTLTVRNLLPIFHFSKSTDRIHYYLFPLLFRKKSPEYVSMTLLPIFSSGKSKNGKTAYKIITPLIWTNRTERKKSIALLPIYWQKTIYKTNDTIRKSTIFPIYRHVESKAKNYTSIFLLYHRADHSQRFSMSIWPFYSEGYRKDRYKKYFSITPFYWHIEKPNFHRDFLFPIFWHSTEEEGEQKNIKTTLFPLYWYRSDSRRRQLMILPLLYHIKDDTSTKTTLFPFLLSRKTSGENEKSLLVLPLFWKYRSPNKHKDVLFPIWWNTTKTFENDTIRHRMILPFFSLTQSKRNNSGSLFPLFFWRKSEESQSYTLFPLYFSKRNNKNRTSSHIAGLLFWSLNYPQGKQRVLFPVIWYSESNVDQKEKKALSIFPILWLKKSEIRKSAMLFPLAYYSKAKGRERLGLFPIFWHSKGIYQGDTLTTNMLTPLYWSFSRQQYRFRFIAPIFLQTSNRQQKTVSVFPIFSIGNSLDKNSGYRYFTPIARYTFSPQNRHFYLFPLINIKKTDSIQRTSVLYFLYRREKSDSKTISSALWPLIENKKTGENHSFRIAPFLWFNKTETSKMSSFQPLYYSYRSNEEQDFRILWHLYRFEKKKDEMVSHSILWKVFEKNRYDNGDYETRFLYFVYTNINKSRREEFGIFPFYRKTSTQMGDKNVSIFLGFYSHVKRALPEVNDFYVEERLFWLLRIRSNYDRLKSEGKEKGIRRR